MRETVGILETWGGLGRSLRDEKASQSRDWTNVLRIVSAAKPWFEACREELDDLLNESDTRLRKLGLGEPLYTDLGAHRWLRGKREEVYSDWLAWVISQVASAKVVFRMFGIPCPVAFEGCDAGSVDREVWILNDTRKLDVVISFRGMRLIVVELKKGVAQDEQEKLADYHTWCNQQEIPHRILLGAETEPTAQTCGFEPRRWDELCVVLRQIACTMKKPIVGAMVLAFVGAVERNLLGFSAPDPKVARELSRDWPRTADHIRKFLEGDYAVPRRQS